MSGSAAPSTARWPTCLQGRGGESCRGRRYEPFQRCLAHLTRDQLSQVLAPLGAGQPLDARGTRLTVELVEVILKVFGRTGRHALFGTVQFDDAEFVGAASFSGARFNGTAEWVGARFRGPAIFSGAEFAQLARFDNAEFDDHAGFVSVQFQGPARFQETRFSRSATFDRSTFAGDVQFSDAQFISGQLGYGGASFTSAVFGDHVRFDRAQFKLPAVFRDARFEQDAGFEATRFDDAAWFRGASFARADRFGPVVVAERLTLDGVTFGAAIQIEAAAKEVSASQASFGGVTSLQLRYATITLDGMTATASVTVVGAGAPFVLPGSAVGPAIPVDESVMASRDSGAVLLSLRGVDASRLVLVDLDLTSCRFVDAHHLDQLRIEGRCRFPDAGSWERIRPWLPWRYSSRQALAEEHEWRDGKSSTDESSRPSGVSGLPDAVRLSELYRQLRKAQEDAKNEPGAADFYYGEMEMRRHGSSTRLVDRVVLGLYWLLSGYGLRAARALIALALLLAVGAWGFKTVGFADSQRVEYRPTTSVSMRQPVTYVQVSVPDGRPGWRPAFDHSVDSATSLLRSTQSHPLTLAGRILEIALRVLGPLLLALAVLAVRSRVKR